MNTMDRVATDTGSCLAYAFFAVAALIAVGIGYLIAKWTGVVVVAALLFLWYLSTRKRAKPPRG
jgi:hypothetical protein